jgi:hypothetical protein
VHRTSDTYPASISFEKDRPIVCGREGEFACIEVKEK